MQARALRSTLTADAHIRLSLDDVDLGSPADNEIIVRVDAAPVNPTDTYLMLSGADLEKGRVVDGAFVAPVSPAVAAAFAARVGQALAVGTEGAGTVVAAGANAQALLGKVVALAGGGMYATHRKVPMAMARALPAGLTAEQGASAFVNPMTALSFVETMRAERHSAIVHTAAASNLGQMLVKICAADNVPLVNIVRRAAQAETLRALGARHVLDSSSPTFTDDLVAAIAATNATIAFDAIGGGPQVSQILNAMERVTSRSMKQFSHYGSSTLKQAYIYGSLDRSPTPLVRTFGLAWSVGGYLVSQALAKLGPDTTNRMATRVMSELTTTFASHYTARIGLSQLLDPATLRAAAATTTGEKYLVAS